MDSRSISAIALLAAVGHATAFNLVPRQATNDSAPAFDWNAVTPAADLKTLVPCFESFQCGRLNVPLDHSRTDGPNAIIAVALFPATDKANYKGSILINPGGPGNSGVETTLGLAPLLSQVVGPQYDIVGYDPRGTGASIPSAKCFDIASWVQFSQSEIWSVESKEDLAYALARDEITALECAESLGGTGKQEAGGTLDEWGGGHFMNTAAVATDILRIVQALGQDKLNSVGGSYGTVLSATFASMYPDNIGLMVIDGVIDSTLWHAGHILDQGQDGDKVVGTFFELCSRAGKAVCPIAEATAAKTAERVDRIFAAVKARPIAVTPHVNGYNIVTYDALRGFLRYQVYTPVTGFPELAAVLAAVEARNTTALYNFGANNPETGLPPMIGADQALQVISCSDFPDLSNTTLDQAWGWVRDASRLSKYTGSVTSRVLLECIPWKMRAAKRFEGTIGAKKISGKLLFTSNVYDPITPLAHARSIQKRFPADSSALVIQNTIGHCALLNLGSCTAQAVGAFFQAGVLPKSGTVCEPDELPFVGAVTKGIKAKV